MPVGAVIGGAVIGGAATIGSGVIGAGAQRDAANTAASTSAANTAANNALFRETRAQNLQIASPFYNNGLAAGNALNDLLLGTHTYNPAVTANPTIPGGGTFPTTGTGNGALNGYSGPSLAEIQAMRSDGIPGNYRSALAAYNAAQRSGALRPQPVANDPTTPATTTTPTTGTTTPATGGTSTTPTPSALSAFDQFRAGTNYNFRLNEGLNALNSNLAARGMSDSGAAFKGIVKFGQNFASNELSNYMNLLAGQQQVGLSAGNAVMGVSTSAANAIAGQNTNAANAAANAALASGQAQAGMYGAIGSGIGQIGGALTQYGLGQMNQPAPYIYAPPIAGTGNVTLPPATPYATLPGGFG